MMYTLFFVLFSGTTGNLVTNPRAYSVGCRPPSLLTGSSSSVSTTGSGSSHHHSRHKSRFIDIPGATTASGTSGTGTGSQASSFRCVSTVAQCTLLVFIDFCPVQGELLTWTSVTKTLDILPEIIIEYQIQALLFHILSF